MSPDYVTTSLTASSVTATSIQRGIAQGAVFHGTVFAVQVAVGALLRVPAVLPAVRGDFAWVVAGHAINAAAGPGMRWAPGPDLCCVI